MYSFINPGDEESAAVDKGFVKTAVEFGLNVSFEQSENMAKTVVCNEIILKNVQLTVDFFPIMLYTIL